MPKRTKYSATMLLGGLAVVSVAFGQAPGAPAFAVATIKPGKQVTQNAQQPYDGGYSAKDATVKDLISFAYDLPFGVDGLIAGGPKWAYTDTFDVEAKTESDIEARRGDRLTSVQATTLDRMMLQNLLASRFKLRIHHEAKEIRGFALTVAQSGPKLKHTDAPPAALADGSRTYAFGANLPTPNPGPLTMRLVRGDMHAPQATMGWLAGYLQFQPELQGQTVMDRTSLPGNFDISLRWSAEGTGGGDSTKSDSDLPSLFDALQEQLGLKLQSERIHMQSIVIDHIERPTEN